MAHLAPARRANVLVLTLIVLAGVGSVLALTSQRLAGTRSMQSLDLSRQQACYAAEAIASLVETKLVQASGDLNNLTKNVIQYDAKGNNPTIAPEWLQQGLYQPGALTTQGMWIGNSLVYWRIEPVKIYDHTINDTNKDGEVNLSDKLSSGYSDNYQANPDDVVKPLEAWQGKPMNGLNPGYYHFRITTTAFYINQAEWAKNGVTVENADPWNHPEQAVVTTQTQRMVQLKLINLFRYVLFYGAHGATGDIELNPGAQLDIKGAVHTNGAMYLGGQGNKYLSGLAGDYTDSATSGAAINIGSASKLSTITGIDGIFRTRKVGNYWYQAKNSSNPSMVKPYEIPLPPFALNGTDKVVSLNGVQLLPSGDSRNGLVGHSKDYVRDQRNRQAATVNTLANIPQLAGYPFEPQKIVGRGQPLFKDKDSGDYTIRPKDFTNVSAQFYEGGPGGPIKDGDNPTLTSQKWPVYATDLPLFLFYRTSNGTTKLVEDIYGKNPVIGTVDLAAAPATDGLNYTATTVPKSDTYLYHPTAQVSQQSPAGAQLEESRGYYLQNSLFGKTGSGRTGLTIRERGATNRNTEWPAAKGIGLLPQKTDPVFMGSESAWVTELSFYMARNYVVYFGLDNSGSPADITEAFFGLKQDPITKVWSATYTTKAQMPALEEKFMNRREADSYRRMGYLKDNAQAANYRVNVLSLNVGRIQELIRTTQFSGLYPSTALTIPSYRLFNGMVYAHRTPRLATTLVGVFPITNAMAPYNYHPTVRIQLNLAPGTGAAMYNDIIPNGVGSGTLNAADGGFIANALYPIVGSVRDGMVNTGANNPYYIGQPEGSSEVPEVWSVFPSPKQVRVFNGGKINWGEVQPSGRLQGLTVVTPNHCYIQGDYNTTADPKKKADGSTQYPPCGIYADGMTMLTNAWVDNVGTYTSTPNGNTTTYNVSLVTNNIPTDFENSWDEGSGGTHNLLRFLEGGGRDFNFFGSIVVLNRMRYARNYLGAAAGYYGAPTRHLNFNDDLLTAEGQPPFSPWGIQVTRVLSSVNLTNK